MEDPLGELPADGGQEFNDLPDFASAHNKQLHAALRAMEHEVVQLDAEFRDATERTRTMREHLANVQAEAGTTQQLVDARSHEIATEDHLKQLAERERGRFVAELRKHAAEVSELREQLGLAQGAALKATERMDAFKLRMNWSQEELEQWALAARQKEEDALALARYAKADEARIRELNLQIEKMMAAAGAKRAELEAEVTDTQAQQIVLDKTAEDFRALHAERQALVRRWEEAVGAMQRRDRDIEAATERFRSGKAALAGTQAAHAEREAALAAQLAQNEALDAQIGADERELAAVRRVQAESSAGFGELTDQLELMRATLAKAAAELARARGETASLAALLDERKGGLERKRRGLQRAEADLTEHAVHALSLEQASKEVDALEKDADARAERAERALAELKERLYKESEGLFAQRRVEADVLAEMAGAQRMGRNASARVRKLDEEAERQRELVYNADFKAQLLERRLARMQGVRTEAERRDLTKQIKLLTEEVEGATAQHAMLNAQLRRLRNDLAAAARSAEALQREEGALQAELAELTLRNGSSAAQLKALVAAKGEKAVAHDVAKLEVRKLREAVSALLDETLGLDNRKAQLALSVQERSREVGVHADTLRARLRAAEDERHGAAKQLAEREMRIEKLRTKFAVVAGRAPAPEGGEGGGQGSSQAYYLIRAAQEREELRREGDELDAAIGRSERQIRALGKTLEHLQLKNGAYRQSLAPVERGAPLHGERARLEAAAGAQAARLRTARLQAAELGEEAAHMEQTQRHVTEAMGALGSRLGEFSELSETLRAEVAAKREQQERSRQDVGQTLAELRGGAPGGAADAPLAAELAARLVEESTRARFMVDSLRNLADAHDGAAFRESVSQMLTEGRLVAA